MFDFDMPPLDWRECDIPKQHKPWEKRHLTIPNDELKKQQVKVLHFLYTVKELRPSGFAHGFVPHRNTSSGVDRHDRNADRYKRNADRHDRNAAAPGNRRRGIQRHHLRGTVPL